MIVLVSLNTFFLPTIFTLVKILSAKLGQRWQNHIKVVGQKKVSLEH